MKTRHTNPNGGYKRKHYTHTCKICGIRFLGRSDHKACSPECTTKLRQQSARNRKQR